MFSVVLMKTSDVEEKVAMEVGLEEDYFSLS